MPGVGITTADDAEIRCRLDVLVLQPTPLVGRALAAGDAVLADPHQRPLLAVVRLHDAGVVPVVMPEHFPVEGQTEQIAILEGHQLQRGELVQGLLAVQLLPEIAGVVAALLVFFLFICMALSRY